MMNERMSSTDLSSITTHNPNFTIMNKTSIMQGSFVKKAELGSTNRRLVCRYGRGCTHSNDIVHREQYWHPSLKEHECNDQMKTHFICNECAFATPVLKELQVHLMRKTAWSNSSLIGCRINCLIDSKEWHEGYVSQFRSGKHFVEFRMIGERRWMNMKKLAFYIMERPSHYSSSGDGSSGIGDEFKDNEISDTEEELAPLEDDWEFVEDISLQYAFAQSLLFKIYGNTVQETGHKTKGHTCLTNHDRVIAQDTKGSLLYGELLPRGVNKALGAARLGAHNASVLFDLGMGTGKVAIQSFVQFQNLTYVFGVELSEGRYKIAEAAVLYMVNVLGSSQYKVNLSAGKFVEVVEQGPGPTRTLRLVCGDMFHTTDIDRADIVMLETDVPLHLQSNLCNLLSTLHVDSKVLTYLDLQKTWLLGNFPFQQMDCNKPLSDRFPTSWSVQRGHHFFIWTKTRAIEDIVAFTQQVVGTEKGVLSKKEIECKEGDRSTNTSRCFPFAMRIFSLFSSRSTTSKNSTSTK